MKINPSLLASAILGILITNLIIPLQIIGEDRKPFNFQTTFRIVQDHKSVPIIFDKKDEEVVGICARALAKDIELITSCRPNLETSLKSNNKAVIIIGTLGSSDLINNLIKTGKISQGHIKEKWESFIIQVVDHPFAGINKALVIAGSDPRGTAFGVF